MCQPLAAVSPNPNPARADRFPWCVHDADTDPRRTGLSFRTREEAERECARVNRARTAPTPAPARFCEECGAAIARSTGRAKHARYCSTACRMTAATRNRKRGTAAVDLMTRWRKGRHVKGGTKGLLTDMARLADQWIADDTARARALKAGRKGAE